MAKNDCSEFFLTIFPKKMGRNSEWPKLGIPNLFKPFWCTKTGIGHSKFMQTFLVQKDWKKFGMAKIGHSKFIQTSLVEKDCKKFKIEPSESFRTILVQNM